MGWMHLSWILRNLSSEVCKLQCFWFDFFALRIFFFFWVVVVYSRRDVSEVLGVSGIEKLRSFVLLSFVVFCIFLEYCLRVFFF